MAKSKGKNFISYVSYILLLLLLVGGIGFVAVFTDGFTDSFKTFYVSYNGKKILNSQSNLTLPLDAQNRFDVKYTFAAINKNQSTDYSVKIITNHNHDFDFTVNGELHSFLGEGDYTEYFDLALYDGYFTLTLDEGITIESVLSKKYSGETVTADVKYYKDYFLLLIYSHNKKSVVEIGFHPPIPVERLSLDKEWIVL